MALSHQQRDQLERRIRAAIDRLLAGQIPPGGACDIKTLAREAGISRAALYRTWGHLKDEFEKRRAAAQAAGQQPDPREARIAQLRDLNQRLTGKLARTHTEFNQLKERHRMLLSALAAKDDELQRLRRERSTFSRELATLATDMEQGGDAGSVIPLPAAERLCPSGRGGLASGIRSTRGVDHAHADAGRRVSMGERSLGSHPPPHR